MEYNQSHLGQNGQMLEDSEVNQDSEDDRMIGFTEEQTFGLGSICCFDATQERSFFMMIMTLIFCSLFSRILFFMIIYVSEGR